MRQRKKKGRREKQKKKRADHGVEIDAGRTRKPRRQPTTQTKQSIKSDKADDVNETKI